MKIAGIDVGQKNLGVCIVDSETRQVHYWAVWNCVGTWAPDVYTMLQTHVTPEFLEGLDVVVIERQPSKNPTMTRIMHYLEFYFVSKDVPVRLQDSKHKLLFASTTAWFPKDTATDAEWTYRHRKKLAVETVANFVQDTDQPLASTFADSKKKDDLADALLHALAHGAFGLVTKHHDDAPAKPRKIVARAPTERQRRTGKLSPSNIKYLLRGCTTPDEVARRCKRDKALGRCLQKHFQDAPGFFKSTGSPAGQ